jgi:TetR/AcrR family transcriptional regulator, mexJK operon transcriptional repressor
MLNAAKAVFVEKGYARATLDDVIAKSGGSRATIYQQFGSKEGLFAAIIAEICANIVAPLTGRERDEEPSRVLLSVARSYMSALMEPTSLALYRVLIGEGERFPEFGAAVFRSGPAVAAETLATYLARWDRDGRLAVEDPRIAARQLLEMIKGDLHLRALLRLEPPSEGEIEHCVTSAVRVFLRGLSK